jgi:zinc transporter 1/2/3
LKINTLSLFLAIVAHKWAASLTLGISIVKSGVEKKQLIIMVLIFAFIGPVGVAVGLILSETANDYLQGIFLAISVGTFIYIACSEVLVEEFENPDNKFLKFFMFMVGGVFIGSLSLIELALNIEE